MDNLIFLDLIKSNKKVVGINDPQSIFAVAKNYIDKGEYATALSHLKRYAETADGKEDIINAYFYISQVYYNMSQYEFSNHYLFKMLKFNVKEMNQLAYLGLGSNFLALMNFSLAKFYLNQCADIDPKSELGARAKSDLNLIDTKFLKKFKIVGGSEHAEEDLRVRASLDAEKALAEGDFESAVKKFETADLKKDAKSRTSLALCHFLLGDTSKAVEVTTGYGEPSLLDLCNLAIFYDALGQKDKVEECVNKMLAIGGGSLEELYKMGVTFSQLKRHPLAMKYLGKYVSFIKYDPQTLLLYGIACLNCTETEIAKQTLIAANNIEIYENYLYKNYLKLCEEPARHRLNYVFGLQAADNALINKQIKEWMTLSDAKFKKVILENIPLINWIVRNNTPSNRISALLRTAKIKSPAIDEFFEDMLLDTRINKDVKYLLLAQRLKLAQNVRYNVVADNLYSFFTVPDFSFAKGEVKEYFVSAYFLAQMFILEKNLNTDITIKMDYAFIKKYAEFGGEPDEGELAALLIWRYSNSIVTKKELCDAFMLKEKNLDKLFAYFGV